MALTRVSGGILKQPIDVGIITATSLNASGIVTAGTVQVGSATTIHTTGIDLGSGNVTSHNINSTGIITATSFVGPVTGNLTGNADTASNLTGSPSITVTNITASGNVSIAGTLTYEDVTNIDSVGIITAQGDISIADKIVHTGDTNTALRFPSADTITAETSGSERLRITSDGNIGIGTDTFTATSSGRQIVEIEGASGSLINFAVGGARKAYHFTDGTDVYSYNTVSGSYIFGTNNAEKLRIDSSGRLLKSGQASLTSTSLSHSIQVAAASDANAIAIIGRAADDIGELSFYEADKSTKLGELQYRQDHVNIRHRVGDIVFATGGTTERLRIASDGDLEYRYNDADTSTEVGATQVPHGFRILNQNNTLGRLGGITFSHGGGETANAGIFHETTNTANTSTVGIGDLTFWTKPTGASHIVERLRITSAGYLGISNTVPRGIVHVGVDLASGATDAAAINLKQTSTTAATGIYLERSGERRGYAIYVGGGLDSLNFQRNNVGTKSDVMTMTRDGKVGINNTSPAVALDVDNAIRISRTSTYTSHVNCSITHASSVDYGSLYFDNSNATGDYVFRTTASYSERLRIKHSGEIITGFNNLFQQRGYFDTATSNHNSSNCPAMAGVLSYGFGYQEGFSTTGGSWTNPYPNLVLGYHTGLLLGGYYGYGGTRVYADQPSRTSTILMSVGNNGNGVSVTNSLSKGGGTFRIAHPHPSKKYTHDLQHSFIEGPQCDNLYRGRVDLVDGTASINIDIASNMTDGTFVLLNRDIQCFTSNETGWDPVKGSVSGNILTITSQNNSSTDTISWMVIGERQDDKIKSHEMEMTDSDGKLIVEPLTIEQSHM